jgi:uncharacterized protein YdaU (DUF1376 family)
VHHYPFNPSKYYLSTGHWSEDRKVVECEAGLLRDLAYRRLLDLYYGDEEPIPSKTRLVAIRIRMLRHEDIVASVLREKFVLEGGFWRQSVADEEIERYQRRASASRENGKLGGRPKNPAKPKRNLAGSQQALTRTRTRTTNTPLPPEGVEWFEEFWKTYPRKAKKPDGLKAFGKALTRATFTDIMAGLRKHLTCDQWQDPTKIPYPASWLNGDQWNDTPAAPPTADGDKPGGWWTSRQGLLERAVALGVPPPADDSPQGFMRFKAAVWVASGDGPWWDDKDTAYALAVRLRNEGTT